MDHNAVTTAEIVDGLARLGLARESSVLVHASLRSFGRVEGGAAAVIEALTTTCGTVVMMAGASDLTKLPAPPGLVRPDNAYDNAQSWKDFNQAVAAAMSYNRDLPVSSWLGHVAEQLRVTPGAVRGPHPLYSFVTVGQHAVELPNVTGESHRFDAIDPTCYPQPSRCGSETAERAGSRLPPLSPQPGP